ncbi:substrate-binding periplasmic protein [Leeia sp.]|uniref:substrate-binding periplasmic protein n=1 Tax=Leeia sp. TaxID=2884678 RepID=UPI0035B2078D
MRQLTILLCLWYIPLTAWCEQHLTARFAASEWAPYMGAHLPQQGRAVATVRAAFARNGIQLQVDFYPWARTIALARAAPYDGYLVEYDDAMLRKEWLYSLPVAYSPLGLAERVANPVVWTRLEDLAAQRKTIGVVQGYVNTPELDRLIAQGTLNSDRSADDLTLLHKLAAGRVDVAVMDAQVFEYLLLTQSTLRAHAHQLRLQPRLLEQKALNVVFRKTPRGQWLLNQFNQGLRAVGNIAAPKPPA